MKRLQATVNEGLAQGPYMVVGVGFEPVTFQTQGTELTPEPPRPTSYYNHGAIEVSSLE